MNTIKNVKFHAFHETHLTRWESYEEKLLPIVSIAIFMGLVYLELVITHVVEG